MTDVKKGLYVSIEGIDGAGKSSVLKYVQDALGENTTALRMPGGSEFSEIHRNVCRNANIDEISQVLFYAALNRDTAVTTILPNLQSGNNVVCDRGWVSTLVYQTMQTNQEKLLLNIVESPDIPVPDLVIYLNLPLNMSQRRTAARLESIGFRDLSIQTQLEPEDRYSRFTNEKKQKVKEGYDIFFKCPTETNHYAPQDDNLRPRDDFAVMWKLRHALAKKTCVVDANRPLDLVAADVVAAVHELLNENK